jgi:hypothetical protein
MADQVNVCVKNLSNMDIEVYRELADGSCDLNKNIAGGDEDTTLLPEPGVFLVISTPNAPNGMDTQPRDLYNVGKEKKSPWPPEV